MAKKATKDKEAAEPVETGKDPMDILASISRSMNKTFGANTTKIIKEGEIYDNVSDYILTGVPVIDNILGGKGFPVGRISEIYGDPSSGKTAIAMHVMKTAIERGGVVFMLDSEQAFGFDMAQKIGLDIHRFGYDTPKTLEEIWRQVDKLVDMMKTQASDKLCLIVVDSIAAASCENEIANDISKAEMGERARINSKALRRIGGEISENKICLLLLNQVRVNIGVMYGDSDIVPGGKAIDFHATIKLRVNKGPAIFHPNNKKLPIGQISRLKVVKNKVAPPYRTCEIEMFFDQGIPKYSGLVAKLLDEKVFARKGGSIVFQEEKFQEEYIGDFIEHHPYLLDLDNLGNYRTEQSDE